MHLLGAVFYTHENSNQQKSQSFALSVVPLVGSSASEWLMLLQPKVTSVAVDWLGLSIPAAVSDGWVQISHNSSTTGSGGPRTKVRVYVWS